MNIKVTVIEQLRQVQSAMTHTAYCSLREHSSYRGRGRVLGILNKVSEISRKELEDQLGISRQGLTELLSKMEKSGHITKEKSAQDRRGVVIRLTEQGKAAAAEADVERSPLPGLLDCLTGEELNRFSGYLERILAYQRELYPEKGAEEANGCDHCTGPENCNRDYLKYGHTRPNAVYCRYARLFPAPDYEKMQNHQEQPEGGQKA